MNEAEKKADGTRGGICVKEYASIHQWILKTYGKASCCTNKDCKSNSAKNFEWALIKGYKYERNISNFMELCCSCHRKYDITDETRKKLSESNKGKTPSNKGIDSRVIKKCIICNVNFKTYVSNSKSCSKSCGAKHRQNKLKLLK